MVGNGDFGKIREVCKGFADLTGPLEADRQKVLEGLEGLGVPQE